MSWYPTIDSFTKGTRIHGNQLARIYDRLRKRSLRTDKAINILYDTPPFSDDGDYDHAIFESLMELSDKVEKAQYGTATPSPHEAYVRGVRDALAAVEKEGV